MRPKSESSKPAAAAAAAAETVAVFAHKSLDAHRVALGALSRGDAIARRLPRGYCPLRDQISSTARWPFLAVTLACRLFPLPDRGVGARHFRRRSLCRILILRGDQMASERSSVLLVDDDDAVLEAYSRVLTSAGFDVHPAPDGARALELLQRGGFDAVVSDISMPGMDGLQLLREVRRRDRDLPVILMTGRPTLETATRAIDYGVLKYLMKPVSRDDIAGAVRRAVRLYHLGRAKREALGALGTMTGEASDRAGLETSFDRALDSLWMAFQPIVSAAARQVFAYEALLRSEEPTLPHPGAVIDAAQRLGQLQRLGRAARRSAAEAFASSPPTCLLFLNLHPEDLLDDALFAETGELASMAERVVLEMTERSSLDLIPDVRDRVARLRAIGYRIAVDDLGAGYAGLATFVQMEPDFVKLDMSLIRGLHQSSLKRRLVRSMTSLCQEMGLGVVAEGVETPEERDSLVELGLDLLQGYHFSRPARPFATPSW